MIISRPFSKPVVGTTLDIAHPLYPYIDLCLPFNDGPTQLPWDQARGQSLLSTGPVATTWAQGALGGLVPTLSAAGGWRAEGAGQFGATQPFTLSFWLRAASWPSTQVTLFSTGANNTAGWALVKLPNSSVLTLRFHKSAAPASTATVVAGAWQHWTIIRNGGTVGFYVNGLLDSFVPAGTVTPVTQNQLVTWINAYAGTVGLGNSGTYALDNVLFFKGVAFTPQMVADLHANPWQLHARRPSLAGVSAIAPTMTAVPNTIYASGANQSVDLVGFDRSWTPGSTTTFSLTSKPTGVSIASQSVTDADHATVILATDSTHTGTVVITDTVASTSVAVEPTSFTASPTSIPSDHPGNIALTLTGLGTSWKNGTTTFSLQSPPTGCTLVSQVVNSATSATLVVATGTGTGTLTISDAAHTATVQVSAASLSAATAAATVMVATGTYTITLTGTNTVWTQETPSGLFTASGIAGATISGVAVVSDTTATVTLALGSSQAGGSIAIHDNSTGATSGTLTVSAPSSGSLHVAGPCFLASTTGSAANFFSGATAATIAFDLEIDSNAGIPTSNGTIIAGFTSGGNFATYDPASGNLTFTLSGAGSGSSNTFSPTIQIQVGVGYRFLISWSVGSVSLYVDGVLYAAKAVPSATGAYSGIKIGGNNGSASLATDHRVANLVGWAGYAATADDALALATGTKTPLQIGSPAFWFPLGGGTVGASPDIADPGLADCTGNGNTLSLFVGSTSATSYADTINVTPLVIIGAEVDKSGQVVVFNSASASPGNPMAQVTGVGPVDPTIYCQFGGTGEPQVVSTSPAVWFDNSHTPFVWYLLECGGVDQVAIPDAGEGYTSPVVTAPGCTFGTPVLQSGVTGYVISGTDIWTSAPNVAVSPPNSWELYGNTGPNAGNIAVGHATVSNGTLSIKPAVGGQIGCGSKYSPTAPPTIMVGVGSRTQLTPTVSGGVITKISVSQFGLSHPATVKLNISDPTGSGASANLTMAADGAGAYKVTGVTGLVGGQNYTNPSFTIVPLHNITGVLTSGSAVVTAVSSTAGLMVGMSVTGAGVPDGTTIESIDSGTITLSANATDGDGSSAVALACASTTAVVPVISKYIAAVPVVSGSSGMTTPPTITVTDSGGSFTGTLNNSTTISGISSTAGLTPGMAVSGAGIPAGTTIVFVGPSSVILSAAATGTATETITFGPDRVAQLQAIMSGVSASDVLTYDAPASWFTPSLNGLPLGGVAPVTGGTIHNYTGQTEGQSGAVPALNAPRTLLAGANHGAQPGGAGSPLYSWKNRFYQGGASPWQVFGPNPGVLTIGPGFLPDNWTNPGSTNLSIWCVGPSGGSNGIDQMGQAGQFGQYTLQYDEPNFGTALASYVTLGGSSGIINLSGPNAGSTAPVKVAAADITVSGGQVAAIGVANTPQLATGDWQAAFVQVTGGGGSGAFFTARVSGGKVTQFDQVCGGKNFTTPGTIVVNVYGRALSGTNTVRGLYDFEPGPSPTSWTVNVSLSVAAPANNTVPQGGPADGDAHWNLPNLWIVAPEPATMLPPANPIDVTKPFAADDGVIGMLTGPSGKGPGSLRFMDATGTFGGISNFVLPGDLPNPHLGFWQPMITTLRGFQYARYVNTDPAKGPDGDGTYAWVTGKVYGPGQPWATSQDAPYTITGTITAGSPTLTDLSADLVAGATVSGLSAYGIPDGSMVHHTTMGAMPRLSGTDWYRGPAAVGQATLFAPPQGDEYTWDPAAPTSSATSVTITVTDPPYWVPSADDGGRFLALDSNTLSVELRSTTPHGLVTGVWTGVGSTPGIYPSSGAAGLPMTNGNSTTDSKNGIIYVTGPYTVAVSLYVLGDLHAGTPQTNLPQTIPSTTEIDLTNGGTAPSGWQVVVYAPRGAQCMPFEHCATTISQLPGTAHWLNIPFAASDVLVKRIAAAVAGPLAATDNEVWIEWSNEPWNGSAANYPATVDVMLGELPAGTSAFGGRFVADGTRPSGAQYGAIPLLNAWSQDVFVAEWTRLGLDPARVKRIQNAMTAPGNGPATTREIMDSCARWGLPVDFVCVAPYLRTSGDAPIVNAFSPAGSTDSAGSWPMGAIIAVVKRWMAFSQENQALFAPHVVAVANFGQPIYGGLFIAGPSAGAGDGALPLNVVYTGGYTFVDGQGRETTLGTSRNAMRVSAFAFTGTLAAGKPQVTGIPNTSGLTVGTTLSGTGIPSGTTIASIDSPTQVTMSFLATADGAKTITTNRPQLLGMRVQQWPSWAQSMNIYLTEGPAGTEALFATIPRSQYGAGNKYPIGGGIPLNSTTMTPGWPNTAPPPTTDSAAKANNPSTPKVVSYEGAVDVAIPSSVPVRVLLTHDMMSHPLAADLIQSWYMGGQIAGLYAMNYFQLWGTGWGDIWWMAMGSAQPAGDGLGNLYSGSSVIAGSPNKFATPQGASGVPGAVPDAHNHIGGAPGNAAPMIKGFRDWFDASSPLVNPPQPADRRRRWFSGLGQSAGRPARW